MITYLLVKQMPAIVVTIKEATAALEDNDRDGEVNSIGDHIDPSAESAPHTGSSAAEMPQHFVMLNGCFSLAISVGVCVWFITTFGAWWYHIGRYE
jgi:hypothetical protein